MKPSSETSVLKSLAVAFGDGLAFGVGMIIAQGAKPGKHHPAAAQVPAEPARTEIPGAGGQPESLDHMVLERLVAALEARLAEHVAQMERRLADTEAKLALEVKGFDSRQAAQATALHSGMEQVGAMLGQGEARVAALEKQVGAAQQALDAHVDERLRVIQETLHRDISAAGTRTADLLVETIEKRLLQRLEALEARVAAERQAAQAQIESRLQEWREKWHAEATEATAAIERRLQERIAVLEATMALQGETMHTLRERATGAEQNVQHLVHGLARLCEQAAQGMPGAEEPPPRSNLTEMPGETAGGSAGEKPRDALNYPPAERGWRVPMISTVAVLAMGVAAAGWWIAV